MRYACIGARHLERLLVRGNTIPIKWIGKDEKMVPRRSTADWLPRQRATCLRTKRDQGLAIPDHWTAGTHELAALMTRTRRRRRSCVEVQLSAGRWGEYDWRGAEIMKAVSGG